MAGPDDAAALSSDRFRTDRFPRVVPLALAIVVGVSVAALALVFRGTPQALSPIYYATITLLGVLAFGGSRGPASRDWLRALPGRPIPRAVALGFIAVVLEESLVGTLFAAAEGFTVEIWAQRVTQFIGFNLFAFTGPILGLTIAARVLPGFARWHLLVAGGWGLFAEGIIARAAGAPIAAALIAGPTIAVYSVILAPLVLSIPERAGRSRWWHPLAAWAMMFALSVPMIAIVAALRTAAPDSFPPCDYIPCL
jgi:hypothetical protein